MGGDMPTKEATLNHADGCPKQRTETYRAETPNEQTVTVHRCIDCGAHNVER